MPGLTSEQLRRYRVDPGAFLTEQVVTDTGELMKLEPYQREALAAMFDEGTPRQPVNVVNVGKDSGKSFWSSALVAHHIFFGSEQPPPDAAYYASDEEQASIAFGMLRDILTRNEALRSEVTIEKRRVLVNATQARATVYAHDEPGSHGRAHSLAVADEVAVWQNPSLLHSLIAQTGKRRYAAPMLLAISTAGPYSCHFNSWVEKLSKDGHEGGVYLLRREGPAASWMTPEKLAIQERLLPGPQYRRLWLNEMPDQQAEAAFTKEQIDACFDLDGPPPLDATKKLMLDFGLDVGRKQDLSALVGLHRSGHDYFLSYLRFWRPTKEQPTQIRAIEAEVASVFDTYRVRRCGVDPWGSSSVLDRWPLRCEEFVFSARTKHELSAALYQTVASGRLHLWPDAELRRQLSSLVVRDGSQGFVLEHARGEHDDISVALGVALVLGERLGEYKTPQIHFL
ncbi:MAG: terminase large subunit domain-containing protein [Armatimonadota bacterium]